MQSKQVIKVLTAVVWGIAIIVHIPRLVMGYTVLIPSNASVLSHALCIPGFAAIGFIISKVFSRRKET